MSSLQRSQLVSNISRYKLDSRIGKMMLGLTGSGIRMGEHASRSSGHSPVILDYRHYQVGDPVKDIDWKLSARTEKLFIKIREGYRQTDFVIAVDNSESMKTEYNTAPSSPSKYTTALTMAYIAARIALKSRDKIFFLCNGEKLPLISEQDLIDMLVGIETDDPGADRGPGFWDHHFPEGSNLFIISDFFVEMERFSHFIQGVSHKSTNIYSFIIQDPFERDLDLKGRFQFLDPESEDSILNEAGDIKRLYNRLYHEHFSKIKSKTKAFGIKRGVVPTDVDPFNEFIRILS